MNTSHTHLVKESLFERDGDDSGTDWCDGWFVLVILYLSIVKWSHVVVKLQLCLSNDL